MRERKTERLWGRACGEREKKGERERERGRERERESQAVSSLSTQSLMWGSIT